MLKFRAAKCRPELFLKNPMKASERVKTKLIAYRGEKWEIKTKHGRYDRMIPRIVPIAAADELLESGDWIEITETKNYLMPFGGMLENVIKNFDYSGEIMNFDKEIKKILSDNPKILIMRDGAAGDIIMSVPAVHELKRRIPNANVVYATIPELMDLLAGIECIDEIMSIHEVELNGTQGYDFIINWCRTVENYSIPRNKEHRIDSFAAHLGMMLQDKKTELHIADEVKEKIINMMGKEKSGQNIGIVLQTHSWWRDYPLNKYVDVIKELTRRLPEANLILIDTQELCGDHLKNECPDANIIDTTGKTESFIEAAAVVSMCDIIITPDTGLVHAAGALGIPAVVIMGCISPDVRISTYDNMIAVYPVGRVDCVPCFSHQSTWSERERLVSPERGFTKDCQETKVVKCMEVIAPFEVSEAAFNLLAEMNFRKSKYAKHFPITKSGNNKISNMPSYKFESKTNKDMYGFSVIVPACADLKNLEDNKYYVGLLADNIEWAMGELIVVANGCCNEFIEFLDIKGIKYIELKDRVSYSKACNVGAEATTSDIICFMNSDVLLKSPDWHVPFIEALNDKTIGMVGAEGMQLHHSWCGNGRLKNTQTQYDFIVGWCVWMRKDVLRRVGGWDERYKPYYSEDADISFKVNYSIGLKLKVIDTSETMKHMGGNTIEKVDGKKISDANLIMNAKKLSAKWRRTFRAGTGFINGVAVLIPAHVKREYLIECLESVKESGLKNQTIYVALDRMEFPERINYPTVKFYDVDFGSPAKTRNFLVGESVEPFIYFFDADDILITGAVPQLLEWMKAGDFDVVYGKARIMEQCNIHWFGNTDADGFLNTHEFTADSMREMNFISTQSLVRRSALPSYHPFDAEFPALEDWDLWLTMSTAGAKFSLCDIHLWDYRIHETNLTRDTEKGGIAGNLLRKKHGLDIGMPRKCAV